MLRAGVIMLCVLAAVPARADEADDYALRGETLARSGRWAEAIESFKAAERIAPRTRYSCLIGLAYLRRDLLTQADFYFARCKAGAPASQLPDWLPEAEAQLQARIATQQLAPVEIVVEPAGVAATIAVGTAPGETFAPGALRLPAGKHVITASAFGHAPATTQVELVDASPRRIVLRLGDQVPAAPAPAPAPAPARTAPRSRVPTIVTTAGVATLAGGIAYHVLAFRPARDRLDAATDPQVYDALEPTFERRRLVTAGLYGAGAAIAITGLVLRATVFADDERAPRVTASVGGGGAIVGVEVMR